MKLEPQPVRRNPRATAPANLSILTLGSRAARLYAITPFRINTCKSVSKQRTLSAFKINTYEKPRGGGAPSRLRLGAIRGVDPHVLRGEVASPVTGAGIARVEVHHDGHMIR